MIHNSHVLKRYRWLIFLARAEHRLFHLTVLIDWHNQELASCDIKDLP